MIDKRTDMIIEMIMVACIVIICVLGIVFKVSGAEIETKVYDYNKYECEKIMVLDKKHTVYEIGDADRNIKYLYITGEGTLYNAGDLVK